MRLTVCKIKLEKVLYFANRIHSSCCKSIKMLYFYKHVSHHSKRNVGIALNLGL